MKVYDLPEHVQIYMHTLELHAVILKMRKLMTQDEVRSLLQRKLNHKNYPDAWKDDINAFIATRYRQPLDRHDLALYYLLAGCGINKIQNMVKIGQPAIYRERDRTDWNKHHSPLERMFITDDFALQQVHVMADVYNIMDGYRITDADQVSISYANHQENFKKRKPKLWTPEELEQAYATNTARRMQEKQARKAEREQTKQEKQAQAIDPVPEPEPKPALTDEELMREELRRIMLEDDDD